MTYLILCILSSTGIFLVFKVLDQKKLASFPVIILNYLVASVLGFVINAEKIETKEILALPWIPISVLIGFLFIVMFFIIARSSAEAGISITTVASKMSVVFPISFSIYLEAEDSLNLLKGLAIASALIGVFLTVYSPKSLIKEKKRIFIPLILFLGMGLVDSLVKYAQYRYVSNDDSALFSAVLFAMAFLTGLMILPFRKQRVSEFRNRGIWIWGGILGIVNFGSIYLIVNALNHVNMHGVRIDSSVIYGANNIGIVSLSVLAGLLLFKEKLNKYNWIGISISFVAIILFSFA